MSNLLQEIERLEYEVDSSKNGQIQAQDVAMKALDDKITILEENKLLRQKLLTACHHWEMGN